jgi:hypothetical protein
MRCPSCDTPNTPEARFCAQCGAKLEAKVPPAQAITVEEHRPSPPKAEAHDTADAGPPRRRADVDEPEEEEEEEEEDGGTLAGVIPYRNAKALTAYYLGIFCLIPFCVIIGCAIIAVTNKLPAMLALTGLIAIPGILLAPFAVLLGILGLYAGLKNPSARGKGHALAGIFLGIFTAAVSLVALIFFLKDYNENVALLKEVWKL